MPASCHFQIPVSVVRTYPSLLVPLRRPIPCCVCVCVCFNLSRFIPVHGAHHVSHSINLKDANKLLRNSQQPLMQLNYFLWLSVDSKVNFSK